MASNSTIRDEIARDISYLGFEVLGQNFELAGLPDSWTATANADDRADQFAATMDDSTMRRLLPLFTADVQERLVGVEFAISQTGGHHLAIYVLANDSAAQPYTYAYSHDPTLRRWDGAVEGMIQRSLPDYFQIHGHFGDGLAIDEPSSSSGILRARNIDTAEARDIDGGQDFSAGASVALAGLGSSQLLFVDLSNETNGPTPFRWFHHSYSACQGPIWQEVDNLMVQSIEP